MAKSTSKTKTGLYINDDVLKCLKYIEYTTDKTRTDILNEALIQYIKQWEQQNHKIPKK
jgi:predicted transcriptional regulator